MQLSVVTTLYRSEKYLREFHRRISCVAAQSASDYELIVVNDGSPDESLALAVELARADRRVCVVDLSRNFGHHKAMMTGLAYARGEYIFLIDSDLEEPPEILPEFRTTLSDHKADVVYGYQESRKGGWFERFTGSLFYRLFNLVSTQPITPNLVTARLMSRRYVQALLRYHERELVLSGVWAATGYKQVAVPIVKGSHSKTTYTLTRRITDCVNAITSFSAAPLVGIFFLGTFIFVLSTTAALWLIIRRLFFAELLSGWPSLMVSIWMLGGLTLFSVGVVGIYLSKVYMEAKQRPYTIVRDVFQFEDEDHAINRRPSVEGERLLFGEDHTARPDSAGSRLEFRAKSKSSI